MDVKEKQRTMGGLKSSLEDPPASMESSPASLATSLDSLLARLGCPGRHQTVLVLLLATNMLPVMFQEVAVPLYTAPVAHHCSVPGTPDTAPLFLPPLDPCSVWRDPSNHSLGTGPCPRGHTFLGAGARGIREEWALVCQREHLASLLTSCHLLGLLLGGLFIGLLADRLGRRPVMLACLYTQCLLAVSLHFVTLLPLLLVLQGLQGILVTGLQVTTYTLVLELVGPEWRGVAATTLQMVWTGGMVLVAVVAKYVEHWRYIQLALHVPTLATLLYIWIVPESTRWLLCKGRVKKAEVILTSIINYNCLKVDPSSLRMEMEAVSRDLVSQQDARHPPSLSSLLRPSLRLHTLVISLAWLTASLAHSGLAREPSSLLTGDRFLDLSLQGGLALATALFTGLLTAGFGRRGPLLLLLALLGASCLGLASVLILRPPALAPLTTGLTILGHSLALGALCLLFLFTCELLPTVLRARGLACCCSLVALGSLLAPQIQILAPHLPAAPYLALGLLSLFTAVLVTALPDTLGRTMPDTVEEAVQLAVPSASLHSSSDSLDVGYGKCPEFVLVDGLIVSKECSGGWETDSGRGVTESGEDCASQQGTISTLRSSGRREFSSLALGEGVALGEGWGGQAGLEGRLMPLFSLSTGPTTSTTNLVSQHPSLDSSVVSADQSILFTSDFCPSNSAKDGVIKEILRRKLLALDSDETRL